MPTHLFIVNRVQPDLYEDLRQRFASDTNVKVILDRRLGARRMRTAPAAAERRRAERRSRPEVDQKLQTASHTMIVSGSSEAANLREAREWVEGIHDRVGAIREYRESIRLEPDHVVEARVQIAGHALPPGDRAVERGERLFRPSELQPDVAERVAHRNAAKLYRLE